MSKKVHKRAKQVGRKLLSRKPPAINPASVLGTKLGKKKPR